MRYVAGIIGVLVAWCLLDGGIGGAPVQAQDPTSPAAPVCVVAVDAAGVISLDEVVVAADQLQSQLAARLAEEPTLGVVITADASLPYNQVVGVIDAARLAGAMDFAFQVAPSGTASPDGVPLDLPRAPPPGEESVESVLVRLTSDGAIFLNLNESPVPLEQLQALLEAEVARNPDIIGQIMSDPEVPHSRIVAILDAMRQAGIAHQTFLVELPE